MTAAYWSIIFAFILIHVPRIFGVIGQFKMPSGYDYGAPREQQTRLKGIALRGQAAHLNSIEGFAPFAIAVLIALQLGAKPATVDTLATVYAASRLLFVLTYLANLNPWRTIIWFVGLGSNIALFFVAVLAGL